MALRRHGNRADQARSAVYFQVYALRSRATGSIAFVGHRTVGDADGDLRHPGATDALRRSAEEGDTLELIVLADEVDDAEQAVRIQDAVVTAYRAVRLTPERATVADAVVFGDHARTAASRTSSVERVGSGGGPDSDVSALPADAGMDQGFLDGGHRQRLEDLILRQHEEIAALNETVERVRALRDLHLWAGGAGDTSGSGLVRLADIDRALDSSG